MMEDTFEMRPLKTIEVSKDDEFFQFVEKQIDEMREYLKLRSGKEVTFFELEEALKGYSHVHLTLISLFHIIRMEKSLAEESFDQWYAEKFIEERAKHNLPSLAAQKWASQRELDALVRIDNPEEFKRRKEAKLSIEHRESFIASILKMWESYSYTLNVLSSNARAELNTGFMADGVNLK